MIDSAVLALATQLNEFLRRNANVAYDIVRASNLVEQNGNVVPDIDNRLVVFLVNVTKEPLPINGGGRGTGGLGRYVNGNPPVHMTLSVMVAANFNGRHYPDALKFLSNAISFFQRHPVFDHANTPDLDHRIERLVLEIENLNITDLSNLWGILSGKYVPSILYKVRMVTFDTKDVISQTPPISAEDSAARTT
ncbi:MAG: DUF4255 domain-containing protein [Betaproteobacteria bacterium]|nr:DUF4255 domain-containing protein [Betaproteobacteria bacterium]